MVIVHCPGARLVSVQDTEYEEDGTFKLPKIFGKVENMKCK